MTYMLVLIVSGSFSFAPMSSVPVFQTPQSCAAAGEAWVRAANQSLMESRVGYVCVQIPDRGTRRRARPKAK